jgi:hypothetical protein
MTSAEAAEFRRFRRRSPGAPVQTIDAKPEPPVIEHESRRTRGQVWIDLRRGDHRCIDKNYLRFVM